ncbi:MAG: hypothetical protein D6719_08420 [Candidatus Dadabacteria bacterium]|nr:MAG: hypothetical protein D6719_08420 [Candidatus Dadabacteria bacterium]
MIRRINKLIGIALIVGLALYFVLLNKDPITLYISPSKPLLTTVGGIVLLGMFALGVLVAGLVGLVLGVKAYLRERSLQNREKQMRDFYKGMIEARSYLAAGDWERARNQWEKIAKKDPTDVIARIALSESLQGAGDLRGALKILDGARAADPNNIEVLFRAAELNLALGNKTAAIDNLALILYNFPNLKAARMARDLSEELDRLDDALEYQAQLEQLGEDPEKLKYAAARLEYKKLLRDFGTDIEQLGEKLRKLIKRYPNCAEALLKLAEIEESAGNTEKSAEFFIRAARASGCPGLWKKAVNLWIKNNQPERAIAAARSALKDAEGKLKIHAALNLILLYIDLNMFDEAAEELERTRKALSSQEGEDYDDLKKKFLLLQGLLYNSRGEQLKAAQVWKRLLANNLSLSETPVEKHVKTNGKAPSPVLSTP